MYEAVYTLTVWYVAHWNSVEILLTRTLVNKIAFNQNSQITKKITILVVRPLLPIAATPHGNCGNRLQSQSAALQLSRLLLHCSELSMLEDAEKNLIAISTPPFSIADEKNHDRHCITWEDAEINHHLNAASYDPCKMDRACSSWQTMTFDTIVISPPGNSHIAIDSGFWFLWLRTGNQNQPITKSVIWKV